jgi:hypothetical protein
VLETSRRWDAVAVLSVMAAGWLAGNLPAGTGPGALPALSISVADVALLLGFVWVWPVLAEAAGVYAPELVPGSRREAARLLYAAGLASVVPLAAAFLPLGDSFDFSAAAGFWGGRRWRCWPSARWCAPWRGGGGALAG